VNEAVVCCVGCWTELRNRRAGFMAIRAGLQHQSPSAVRDLKLPTAAQRHHPVAYGLSGMKDLPSGREILIGSIG